MISEEARQHRNEYRRAYRKLPRARTREVAYAKEYHKRPEAIVRAKELRDRPEAKAKILAYMAEYRKRPEAIENRKRHLRADALKRYHITEAEFDAMLKDQGGRCAVCGTDQYNNRGPQIDHDHETGKVRGILCNACNGGMGLFKDNTDIMEAAIAYLKGANAKPDPNPSSGIVERCNES
jgi:hypothetical protein